MIWLIANDLDFKAAETDLYLRFPLLELGCLSVAHERVFREAWHESTDNVIADSIDFGKQMPKPRYIWSHLPLELLPTQITEKKSKIITVRREPKDAATSFYHLHRIVEGYKGTADKFFEAFREGLVFIGGCYWHHFASIRKLRSQPNFLSYTYEEMIKDLPSIMRKIASVYNKELTDEEIRALSAHLNITNMKTNKALNS